jgi:hypothetical protein
VRDGVSSADPGQDAVLAHLDDAADLEGGEVGPRKDRIKIRSPARCAARVSRALPSGAAFDLVEFKLMKCRHR